MAHHSSTPALPNPDPDSVAQAVEQITDHAIFRMDLEGKATTWNLGVRNVLGFERDEFIGASLLSLIWTPEDVAVGGPERELETAGRDGMASDDRWMLRKDKRRFWAMGTTTAVHDDAGGLVGYSKVIRDLTSVKRTQDELSVRSAALERTNADLHDLLHLVAHDFKEPLRGILFHLSVLDENTRTAQPVEHEREAVRTLVQRLHALVDAMLRAAETANGELRTERVSLTALAIDAARQVEALREERCGVIALVPPMPDVEVDPILFAQALANLIGNGLKYNNSSPPTPPTVEVRAAEEGERVVIRVKDNGIGIPAQHLESIFRMFKRLHGREDFGGGTGVGLPLARRLVERHGGQLWAQTQEGKGTTFLISLPRAAGPECGR